jgi:hypothetical protein
VIAAALAGAAYAIPGSPLPALLRQAAGWVAGNTPPAPPAEEPTTSRPVTSGIAVPVDGPFTILIAEPQAEGVVTISLTEAAGIVARVLGGAAAFTTDADRLTIDNHGSTASYEIELPRGAARVEVHVGSRRLFLKDGDHIVAETPADVSGRFTLSLSPLRAPAE